MGDALDKDDATSCITQDVATEHAAPADQAPTLPCKLRCSVPTADGVSGFKIPIGLVACSICGPAADRLRGWQPLLHRDRSAGTRVGDYDVSLKTSSEVQAILDDS